MRLAAIALATGSLLFSRPLHTEYWWEPPWSKLDCDREKREPQGEFFLTDPHFNMKYRRYYRRLTECGL